MRSDSTDRGYRYRESSGWWNAEPYHETRVEYDARGRRTTREVDLPSLGASLLGRVVAPFVEDHREEVFVRLRKIRDEKVMVACGLAERPKLPEISIASPDSGYALLHSVSGYSFGRGVMHAEEIPAHAAQLGARAVALADGFSLAGAVEFVRTAKQVGVKPLLGATVEMEDGGELCLLARSKRGFRAISELVTECHLKEPRMHPLCNKNRLKTYSSDVLCLTGTATTTLYYHLARRDYRSAQDHLEELLSVYGRDQVVIQIERSHFPKETYVHDRLIELCETHHLTPIAGGPVLHRSRDDLPALDAVACVHSLCLIDDVVERKPRRAPGQPVGRHPPLRPFNAERYLKSSLEMRDLYADRPGLIENGLRLVERFDDDVLPMRTCLPSLSEDDGAMLRTIVLANLRASGPKEERRVHRELKRILDLGFASHFLIAWDMCRWAREMGIHFSARGSVVDSAIAYQLRFSRINAFEHNLHFDRFLPPDGTKRPDIDIDFDASRREEIRGYLARKFGEDHVATVAAIGTYSTRGIVREVGKIFALPESVIGYVAKRIHGGVSPEKLEAALLARPELRDSDVPREKLRWVVALAEKLADVPRNMRAHSSGVIVSSDPIRWTVPVQPSGVESVPIIQWDKRSAKHFFDKFDVLCLRGQQVLSDTEEQIRRKELGFSVTDVPIDDPETYRTIRSGQLIGIPQSASPAMRQAHIRLKTENLRDASLVQAGIRPGVGGAVKINELIARRRGKPYAFDHPELERILGDTYGIIVFQEQIDMLLQTFGGYTAGEAEDIREAIHKRRRESYAAGIKREVLCRIVDQGFSQAIAEQVYDYVAGFEGYGFAQGHALAFAEISVRSVWCQQRYPSEYFAALLNAQPAGYYGPATIANEARVRGVVMLGPDVNRSSMRFQVEDVVAEDDPHIVIPNGGIRVGFHQIASLSDAFKERLEAHQPYESFFDCVVRSRPDRDELEQLILCGGFDSLHPNRRELLWSTPDAMRYADQMNEDDNSLPFVYPEPSIQREIDDFGAGQRAIYDRRILGLDIKAHLMSFERERVTERGVDNSRDVVKLPAGTRAFVVGNPIRLRFPPTKSGKRVVFFDLEDEFGLLNVTCFDATYQKDGHAIICSPYVTILGETQDRDGHMAFLAHRVYPYRPHLASLTTKDNPPPLRVADFLVG